MAFKMNNPMKKNFGSALNMTEAQRENLPPKLVDIIDKKEKAEGKAPTQMKKDNAPTMRLDSAAMKAMGQPAPVKMNTPNKHAIEAAGHQHVDASGSGEVSSSTSEGQSGGDRPFYLDQSTQERIKGTEFEIKKLEQQLAEFPNKATEERLEMLRGVVARLKAGGK